MSRGQRGTLCLQEQRGILGATGGSQLGITKMFPKAAVYSFRTSE